MRKTCDNCRYAQMAGGDSVDYGSIATGLPEYMEECTNLHVLSLDDDEYYKHTDDCSEGLKECEYFEEATD